MTTHRFFVGALAALAICDSACNRSNSADNRDAAPPQYQSVLDGQSAGILNKIPAICLAAVKDYERSILTEEDMSQEIAAFADANLESLDSTKKFQQSWKENDCEKSTPFSNEEAADIMFFLVMKNNCLSHHITNVPQSILDKLLLSSREGDKAAKRYWVLITFCNDITSDVNKPQENKASDPTQSGTSL